MPTDSRRDTDTFLKERRDSRHFGTMADSNIIVTPVSDVR